jgi:hypothetical protein
MHPELDKWVKNTGTANAEKRYHADVRALLKSFVVGEDFDDDALLFPLSPDREGIWEIRVTFHPQDRIFGGFIRPGEFIATNRKDREALATKGFAPHRARCKAIWTSLCPKHSRLVNHARSELLKDFDDAPL